jgi:hypothetical protein
MVLSSDYKPIENDYQAWIICSSFDLAGFMFQNKFVNRKAFLSYWAPPIRELGKKLDGFFLTQKLGDLEAKDYWEHFVGLIDAAHKHKGSVRPKMNRAQKKGEVHKSDSVTPQP